MSHLSDNRGALRDTIENLRRKGVRLWIENGTLHYRARKGAVTSNEILNLRLSQGELHSLLSGVEGASQFEPRLLARPHPTRAPLAFSQLAHWQCRQAVQGRPIRQIVSATRLNGPLDVSAIRDAVSEVITRHEALRTRVVVIDGVPIQEVVDPKGCSLELVDMRAIESVEQNSEIRSHINSAVLDVTDYAADPLFRAIFLSLGNKEAVLILALDHIVSDGASLAILRAEILDVYTQLMNGQSASLAPVRMQCIDYAIWQRVQLAHILMKQSSDRADYQLTKFPTDNNVMPLQGWGAARFALGADLKVALQLFARRRGSSLTMVVLSLYVAFVLRWCNTFESVVQVITDGRTNSLLEKTVGYLAFPLYVRVAANGCETLVEMLDIVTREYCKAYDAPDLFYSYVQSPAAEFTRSTAFNWLPRREGIDDERLIIRGEALARVRVEFENPLLESLAIDSEPTIVFEETDDGIVGEVNFPKARFSHLAMSRFVDNFVVFVNALIGSPTARILDIAIT